MRGVVLFAHGSKDPLWHLPMEAVRDRIAQDADNPIVVCAYLEWRDPDLPTAVAQLVSQGVTHVRVVPMFLGVGKHVRQDLPSMINDLRQNHASVAIDCLPAVGEHPDLLSVLAKIAMG